MTSASGYHFFEPENWPESFQTSSRASAVSWVMPQCFASVSLDSYNAGLRGCDVCFGSCNVCFGSCDVCFGSCDVCFSSCDVGLGCVHVSLQGGHFGNQSGDTR